MRLLCLPLLSLFILLSLTACSDSAAVQQADSDSAPSFSSQDVDFQVVQVAEGLEHPWGIDWLPDGRMIVTERPGRLTILGEESRTDVSGLPEITADGQGGLLDVRLHPDYEQNEWIYFTYSAPCEDGNDATALDRARLDGNALVERENLYRQDPCSSPGRHYGSRIIFPGDGTVMFTIGDRGLEDPAQDLAHPAGSVIRINEDGSIPDDNPFLDEAGAKPEIYSYGHRNIQGMIVHPETGAIWAHEHGPRGGDELNIVREGENYGWPEVSYGMEYRSDEPVGVREAPGIEMPVLEWTPSIAPSGLAYYDGDAFPAWQGNLFVGALAFQQLRRLELDGDDVTDQEVLLDKEVGRIRDVRQGPDGYLYLLIDDQNGGIYRLEPGE